jgi:hypothetical protein
MTIGERAAVFDAFLVESRAQENGAAAQCACKLLVTGVKLF